MVPERLVLHAGQTVHAAAGIPTLTPFLLQGGNAPSWSQNASSCMQARPSTPLPGSQP